MNGNCFAKEPVYPEFPAFLDLCVSTHFFIYLQWPERQRDRLCSESFHQTKMGWVRPRWP